MSEHIWPKIHCFRDFLSSITKLMCKWPHNDNSLLHTGYPTDSSLLSSRSWSCMCTCMHTRVRRAGAHMHARTHTYSLSKLQLLNIMTNAVKSPKQWFQALSQWQPEKIYWNLLYLPQHITSNFPNLSHDKMGELSTYNCKVEHFLYSLFFKTAQQSHFPLG